MIRARSIEIAGAAATRRISSASGTMVAVHQRSGGLERKQEAS
jgi:hypothetical protein